MQPEEPRHKAELRLLDLEERRMRPNLGWMQTNLRQIQTEVRRIRLEQRRMRAEQRGCGTGCRPILFGIN